MKGPDIILAGIAGTTAFTLFSYLVSQASGKNFKEPELIGKMINRISIHPDKEESQFTGWVMHYLIGISFAAIYKELIDKVPVEPNLKNGIITGAASGFPAALTWHASLDMHPAPPRKKSWNYYAELFFGHIVFGAGCFYVFGALNKRRNRIHRIRSEEKSDQAETKLTPYATTGS